MHVSGRTEPTAQSGARKREDEVRRGGNEQRRHRGIRAGIVWEG